MKYLIVSQFFYPENFRINDVAEHLHSQGHDVLVLTGQPDYPNKKLFKKHKQVSLWSDEFNGIKILRVPVISRGNGGTLRLILNYLSFILSATVFGLTRIKSKPDACLVWASSPITVCLPVVLYKWVRKVPCAVWVQDLWPESISAVGAIKSNFIYKAVGQLVKFIYKNMNYILIQSKGFLPSVKNWGAKDSQIIYMPNWAEELDFQTKYKNPKEFSHDSNKKVLFAGNLGKAQSIETIVQAAIILRQEPITWYLMGDGSELENIKHSITENKLSAKVVHIPRKTSSEVPPYLLNSDLLCVTLKKNPIFSLTIPSKVQTYMASGKPIVAAVDGEASNLINGSKSGLAGPAQDSKSLAKNVKILLSKSPSKLSEFGENGKTMVETEFNKLTILNKIESILEKMVK